MTKKAVLFQAAGEAVIPLLGFFFWEWNLYFILLFFFIDLIVTEFFIYLKGRKIVQYQNNQEQNTNFRKFRKISFVLMISVIISSHFGIFFIQPGIVFKEEVVAFLVYEELDLPIAQGYIIFPLVILGNYSQYHTFFIKQRKELFYKVEHIYKMRIRALFLAISGAILSIVLAVFFQFDQAIYLILILAVKFFVDLKFR